ncbi:MAG: hypothetical protein ACOC3X_03490 [Nanoarchaeota archaeon]
MKRSKTDTRLFSDIIIPEIAKKDNSKKWKKTDKWRDPWFAG